MYGRLRLNTKGAVAKTTEVVAFNAAVATEVPKPAPPANNLDVATAG